MASVRPARSERPAAWLAAWGDRVARLERAAQLPLRVELERPDHAGIDRLLNGVAASATWSSARGAVLIGAGSAVTLDWLDEGHAPRRGDLPRLPDLMGAALHQYTALLPLVQVTHPAPPCPAATRSRR
ncbi:MAG: type III pantothenate kinase [Gemmataceae bacterium]